MLIGRIVAWNQTLLLGGTECILKRVWLDGIELPEEYQPEPLEFLHQRCRGSRVSTDAVTSAICGRRPLVSGRSWRRDTRGPLCFGHFLRPCGSTLQPALAPQRDRSRVFPVLRHRFGRCLAADGLDDPERGLVGVG